MSKIEGLDPALEPLRDILPTELKLGATLNAHGIYATEQFVLRLSPKVHELVDALTRGETDGYDRADLVRAYSTYLHETIHWWQHVGTTTGVILSLCYPTQCTCNIEQLRTVLQGIGPKKPLFHWAEQALKGEIASDPVTLQTANIAVNNALDIDFYKQFQVWPSRAEQLWQNRYFESVGHSYFVAYGTTLSAISETCGLAEGSLPDITSWEPRYEALRAARHEGFYHGSPIRRARIGLLDILEGQARMAQIQFLVAADGPTDWASYQDQGFFEGVYISAFNAFAELAGIDRPADVTDPVVNLFLLVCDMALNSYRGLPLDVEHFEDLIVDLDPGARFTLLSEAVAKRPHLREAIEECSAEEYWSVSSELADETGYDDPRLGLEALDWIATNDPGGIKVLKGRETFNYQPLNLPTQVVFAEFLAFSRDKLRQPEFFCWPGYYGAGDRVRPEYQEFFKDHLSLFSDRADTEQIFPRNLPGKDPEGRKDMLDRFFGSLILYDLTLQWILRDGPFKYDFAWMTGKTSNEALIEWAKKSFEAIYGANPDNFSVVTPSS